MHRWVLIGVAFCMACPSGDDPSPSSATADSGAPEDVTSTLHDGDTHSEDSADARAQGDAQATSDAALDVGPAEDASPESDYPSLPTYLEAMILSNMEAAKVPGFAACIVRDQSIFWCGGFGKSNVELDRDVSEHTPFLLASISKTVTAAALIQLWEAGSLDFEADVDGVLGWDVAHPTDPTPITGAPPAG